MTANLQCQHLPSSLCTIHVCTATQVACTWDEAPDDRLKLIAGSSKWKDTLAAADKDDDNAFATYLASSDSSDSDDDDGSDAGDADAAAAKHSKANGSSSSSKSKREATRVRKLLLSGLSGLGAGSDDSDDNSDDSPQVFAHLLVLHSKVHATGSLLSSSSLRRLVACTLVASMNAHDNETWLVVVVVAPAAQHILDNRCFSFRRSAFRRLLISDDSMRACEIRVVLCV